MSPGDLTILRSLEINSHLTTVGVVWVGGYGLWCGDGASHGGCLEGRAWLGQGSTKVWLGPGGGMYGGTGWAQVYAQGWAKVWPLGREDGFWSSWPRAKLLNFALPMRINIQPHIYIYIYRVLIAVQIRWCFPLSSTPDKPSIQTSSRSGCATNVTNT